MNRTAAVFTTAILFFLLPSCLLADEIRWANEVMIEFAPFPALDPENRSIQSESTFNSWGVSASASSSATFTTKLDDGVTDVVSNFSASGSGSANFTTLGASAAVDLENYRKNAFYSFSPEGAITGIFSPVVTRATYYDTIRIDVPDGDLQTVFLQLSYAIEGTSSISIGEAAWGYSQSSPGAGVYIDLTTFGPHVNGDPATLQFQRHLVEVFDQSTTVNLALPILSGRNYQIGVQLGVYFFPNIQSVLTGEPLDPYNFSGIVDYGNTATLLSVAALDQNRQLLPAANLQFGGQQSGLEYPVLNGSFTPVPEPGSVSLLVLGLAVCGVVGAMRRARA